MLKSLNLIAALSVALIAALSEVSLFRAATNAQEYPGCFMLSQSGVFVDLKGLCPSSDEGRGELNQLVSSDRGHRELNPLVFSSLELKQPILNGNLTQVKGVVTNQSSHPVPLSLISFQLVANEQILASSAAKVVAGDGLKPGESIRFMKMMNQSNLRGIPLTRIQVKILQYQ